MTYVVFIWKKASLLFLDLTFRSKLCKIMFRLRERRAGPPLRDLAMQNLRSCLEGLEISDVNAIKGASPPRRVGGHNEINVERED